MTNNESYTTDEIASHLKVSKLTIYNLIKKGDLKSYRVGRQIRVDANELEQYKMRAQRHVGESQSMARSIVISGQDSSLDLLSRALENEQSFRSLRSQQGSLDSLIAMYEGKVDIVSTHLFDGDTNSYNIPYIRKMLVSKPFVVIKFIERIAGLYVAKGNPKNINTWTDLTREDISIINREQGAGARILLDEQLRLAEMNRDEVIGYDREQTSHFAVASAIFSGQADVGVGIENVAKMANIDFLPMIQESYDLVILNTEENKQLIEQTIRILKEKTFNQKLISLGYMTEQIGDIIWKQ